MCTSIIHNGNKTIVGWNLDLLDMEYKVVAENNMVYIAVLDKTEGWLPLFGANANGNFVAMPTCWPFDKKSDPQNKDCYQIIMLDIDYLMGKKSLDTIKTIAKNNTIYSVPGVTFQAQLTDKFGNVLKLTPGQGYKYLKHPKYSVMTNFSPFKGESETHPWMGLDRYNIAKEILESSTENFDVKDCFKILEKVAQTVCPTVVSMVFDVTENTVYWCENRNYDKILKKHITNLFK